MNITHATSTIPERSAAMEMAHRHRQQDRVNAAASVPSTAIAFDINLGGNSITVTLSDRASGEVFRRLVYDHGGTMQPSPHVAYGQFVDVAL